MSLSSAPGLRFVGGCLALDFVNVVPRRAELSWNQLVAFLESARIITAERGGELLALSRSDLHSAESLLGKARRLGSALRMAFKLRTGLPTVTLLVVLMTGFCAGFAALDPGFTGGFCSSACFSLDTRWNFSRAVP